jgi:hypothetical protein
MAILESKYFIVVSCQVLILSKAVLNNKLVFYTQLPACQQGWEQVENANLLLSTT